jgi:hydrogenase maturation protein HypF
MTQLVANSAAAVGNRRPKDAELSLPDGEGATTTSARRVVLSGGVQGLGVRPAIFRLATRLRLCGSVRNTSRGVEIEVEGREDALGEFDRLLLGSLPQAALVVKLKSETLAASGRQLFTIVHEPATGRLAARVPEDRGLCPDCAREIAASGDRRLGYPFTSCTQCGPRYTVIRAMPFERPDTALDRFPLCADCRGEYERPGDRRFHAQTTACPACGPHVFAVAESNGWAPSPCPLPAGEGSKMRHVGNAAIRAAVEQLRVGSIVAIKGIGGYQLLVDATNQAAVDRLRERKGRRAKPFAVMVAPAERAAKLAYLDATEQAAFLDAAAPIVLARARSDSKLAAGIHPHLNTVGLMRPTTPLHALLANDFGRPLICTSANCEGNPLEFVAESAEKNLADVADGWVHHNREIVRPIDDSVVRVVAGRRVTMRLARGLAPLPLDLPATSPMIALGGYLKAAVAWSNGSQCVLGPHVGDQESLGARERFLAHLKDVLGLYRFRPRLLVHDLHPDYFSTQWAARQSVPRLAVQHHHAHVAAGMLEHGWLDRRVLGVAWDGTGFGTDGTIWGGEFLVCEGSEFERVARVRPFALPGGEAAIREPWRIAVSVCSQLDATHDVPEHPDWKLSTPQKGQVLELARRPKLSPTTSSAGRLIDAAAALILGITRSEFEGQAAMRLEAAADRSARGWYHFPVTDEALAELDWRPLFAGLLEDRRRGAEPGALAMKFHRSLAHGIIGVCRRWSEIPMVLCGGVFQNKLLTELIAEMMDGTSQSVGFPGAIPPNDGGLAAGQLAIAAAKGSV